MKTIDLARSFVHLALDGSAEVLISGAVRVSTTTTATRRWSPCGQAPPSSSRRASGTACSSTNRATSCT